MKIIIFIFLVISINVLSGQELFTLSSDNTPFEDSVLVFKPADYSAKNIYPMVILLNGYSGNFRQWPDIYDLSKLTEEYKFLIVSPDGFYSSWYLENSLTGFNYHSFLIDDLIPFIKNKYSVDPSNIFISGLSMGGHGAITIFLRNPKYFSAAGSTSGILDITKFPDSWKMKEQLGDYNLNKNKWESNSAYYLIDSVNIGDKPIFIDCGTEDFAYDVNLNFFLKAKEKKLKVSFLTQPGDHSKSYWAGSIKKHFDFFDRLIVNR